MTDLHDPLAEPAPGREPWHHDRWDDPEALQLAQTAPRAHRSRIVKWVLFAAAVMVVVGAVVGGAFGMWVIRQVNPPGEAGAPLTFVVDQGDTLQTISGRLKSQGFITHAGVFEWYVKRKGGIEFEPGYYTLKPRDTMGNIVRALRTPPNETFTSVTFPEGFTVAQMAKRVSEKVSRLSPSKFVDATTDGVVRSAYEPNATTSLEGLLFPDTYQVSNGEPHRSASTEGARLFIVD